MRAAIRQTLNKSASFFLDTLSVKPQVGYSLRRLTRKYKGAAIRVRRDSDGLEKDIGFNVKGALDATGLSSFAQTGNASISRFYDQISGKDLTQTVAANQPIIITNGIINSQNNQPSVYFHQLSGMAATAPMANADELDLFFVHRENTRQQNYLFKMTLSASVHQVSCHLPWTDGTIYYDIAGSGTGLSAPNRMGLGKPNPQFKLALYELNHSTINNTKAIIANGTVLGTQVKSITSALIDFLHIGRFDTDEFNLDADISEILVFDKYLTEINRVRVTLNARDYYAI